MGPILKLSIAMEAILINWSEPEYVPVTWYWGGGDKARGGQESLYVEGVQKTQTIPL